MSWRNSPGLRCHSQNKDVDTSKTTLEQLERFRLPNEISQIEAFSEHFRKLSFLSKSTIELPIATFHTRGNTINKPLLIRIDLHHWLEDL